MHTDWAALASIGYELFMRLIFRLFSTAALLGVLLPGLALAQRPLLTVDAVQGQAWVYTADGQRQRLAANDEVDEGSRVVTDAESRVNMRLSRHGRMDLGPSSELEVESLPFSSYATRLRTELQLARGKLRVVWKHPQISTTWPIYIGIDTLRASLGSGEYFFERDGSLYEACVAAGQIALDRPDAAAVETLKPIACYSLARKPALRQERVADDWMARRRQVRAGLPALANAGPRRGATSSGNYLDDYRRAFVDDDNTMSEQRGRPFREAEPVAVEPVNPEYIEPEPVVVASEPSVVGDAVLPEGDGQWALIVGSFPSTGEAAPLLTKLRGLGYPVDTQAAEVRGRTWYRVRVPGYDTVARANRASADIADRGGIDGAWVGAR